MYLNMKASATLLIFPQHLTNDKIRFFMATIFIAYQGYICNILSSNIIL